MGSKVPHVFLRVNPASVKMFTDYVTRNAERANLSPDYRTFISPVEVYMDNFPGVYELSLDGCKNLFENGFIDGPISLTRVWRRRLHRSKESYVVDAGLVLPKDRDSVVRSMAKFGLIGIKTGEKVVQGLVARGDTRSWRDFSLEGMGVNYNIEIPNGISFLQNTLRRSHGLWPDGWNGGMDEGELVGIGGKSSYSRGPRNSVFVHG
jgi:hypothetical protein